MDQDPGHIFGPRMLASAAAVVLAVFAVGCEVDSFVDPANVGRWERTPVNMPILRQLDVLDEDDADPPNLTPVTSEDLVADIRDYVIGEGDTITVAIEDLDRSTAQGPIGVTRAVSELGLFRHPELGEFNVVGYTVSQLEERVAEIVRQQNILKDPQVTVELRQGRQRTFSFIGALVGTYALFKSDLRMLDATAMVGVPLPGSIRTIYIIRHSDLPKELVTAEDDKPQAPAKAPIDDIIDLLENGDDGGDAQEEPAGERTGKPAPGALERSLDEPDSESGWIEVAGQWVQVSRDRSGERGVSTTESGDPSSAQSVEDMPRFVQRVIEVPYDKLRKGDLRYNVVIRPGDVIHVPAPTGGFVFMAGAIARPGTYSVQSDSQRTFKQLVAAAGGFGGGAIPGRVDLTRRIDATHESTIRLNARAIFEGHEPDFFVKGEDLINVGTNMPATFLAALRRGFRLSYGFGFLLDRNFGTDVFGNQSRNNN